MKKIYIGQTWNKPEDRMGKEGGKYMNSIYLYASIVKYGHENFEYSVLAQYETQEEADAMEDYYIVLFQSRDSDVGYNLKAGGRGGKHSEESKKKISESLKGEKSYWFGKRLSNETKQKISKANSGRERTKEAKLKTSKTMTEHHKNNIHPMQGKTHTQEAIKKISESSKGRVFSPESLKKRGIARRMSKEREQKIIEVFLTGIPYVQMIELLDTNAPTIRRVILRNNIPLEREKDHHHWLGKVHSDKTKEQMSENMIKAWVIRKLNKQKKLESINNVDDKNGKREESD